MPKITLILFMLPLFCFGEEQPYPAERAEPAKEPLRKISYEAMLEGSLAEVEALYEEKFKRSVPPEINEKAKEFEKDRINDEYYNKRVFRYRFTALNNALSAGHPYPTVDEKKAVEEKLKTEYVKRFGEPISDFELSITNIYFKSNITIFKRKFFPNFSAVRTSNGALVIYNGLEAKLNIVEWLDFIRALSKCISAWKEGSMAYGGNMLLSMMDGSSHTDRWNLEFFSLSESLFKTGGGTDEAYPPNWKEFVKIMEGMITKIESKAK